MQTSWSRLAKVEVLEAFLHLLILSFLEHAISSPVWTSHVFDSTTSASPIVTSFPTLSHRGFLIFAHTTILGLPREEVQQRCQWLAHETETYPEDAISQ